MAPTPGSETPGGPEKPTEQPAESKPDGGATGDQPDGGVTDRKSGGDHQPDGDAGADSKPDGDHKPDGDAADSNPNPENEDEDDLLGGLERPANAPSDSNAMSTPTLKRMRSDNSLTWAALSTPTLTLYPLDNYTFLKYEAPIGEGAEEEPVEAPKTADEEDQILRSRYKTEGHQRHVAAVLLTHVHQHPHVLLSKSETGWHLPGGRLEPGESETDGIRRILTNDLQGASYQATSGAVRWEITELLAEWWRPGFAPFIYPYLAPHITKPKESIRLYSVKLPEKCTFRMKKGSSLTAVPLFNINDEGDFGPIISRIPQLISRFKVNYTQIGGEEQSTASDKVES